MIIREILPKDKQKVYEITRVFYNSPAVFGQIPDEVILKNIDNCISDYPYVEGFVIEECDEIIGYSMIAKSYSTEYGGLCIWIEDICLLEQCRGKGVASKVFQHIEGLYSGVAVRYRLEVEENNENAIKAYKKNGFNRLNYIQMTKEV